MDKFNMRIGLNKKGGNAVMFYSTRGLSSFLFPVQGGFDFLSMSPLSTPLVAGMKEEYGKDMCISIFRVVVLGVLFILSSNLGGVMQVTDYEQGRKDADFFIMLAFGISTALVFGAFMYALLRVGGQL